jgi:hypothetical protein
VFCPRETAFINIYIVRAAFLSKWRAVSSYLLHGSPNQQESQVKASIQLALHDINSVIGPFASSQFSQEQRLSTLEGIVNRIVHFGFTLFSQAATWELTWSISSGQDGANKLVTFPGLQKVSDGDGKLLLPPSTLETAQTVAIL